MTLQEIFDYCNNHLLENELAEISDIIAFLNEAQNIIARIDLIQATPVEYTLTTNSFTVPADFLRLHKATLDDVNIYFNEEPWAGVMTLPTSITEGTLKLWYFKKPVALSASTPSQVPEIGEQYHQLLADYAAKMYYLIDDDEGMRNAFAAEFNAKIAGLKTPPRFTHRFVNY
jgi:hypothetical protein